MYNANALYIHYIKPVNYCIAPRRGIRRDVGTKVVPHIGLLAQTVAEINARDGYRVKAVYDMGGKPVAIPM